MVPHLPLNAPEDIAPISEAHNEIVTTVFV